MLPYRLKTDRFKEFFSTCCRKSSKKMISWRFEGWVELYLSSVIYSGSIDVLQLFDDEVEERIWKHFFQFFEFFLHKNKLTFHVNWFYFTLFFYVYQIHNAEIVSSPLAIESTPIIIPFPWIQCIFFHLHSEIPLSLFQQHKMVIPS